MSGQTLLLWAETLYPILKFFEPGVGPPETVRPAVQERADRVMPLTDEDRGTALGRPPREWPRPGRRIVWKVTALALLASLGCGQTDAPPEPRILVTGEKFYSNQDVIIRDFFSDMRDGVFEVKATAGKYFNPRFFWK